MPTDAPTADRAAASHRPASRRPLPWPRLVRWALVGTMACLVVVLGDVSRLGGNPVGLIQPGSEGPSAALVQRDFPDTPFPGGVGLDGQQYYAVARTSPLHPADAADALDRPRYRLQHPLYAWTAWALHPWGGGLGLVYTMLLVGVASAFAGGLALGALSVTLRGPPWLGVLFPVLPGTWLSLRVSTADAMAVALALAALVLSARNRHALAVAAGVAAVLTKEPTVLVLAGWALAGRRPKDVVLVAVPAAVAGAWFVALRSMFPGPEPGNGDITWPLRGLYDAWTGVWSTGDQWIALTCVAVTVAVAVAALVLRPRTHPLWWAVAAVLGFALVAGPNPIGQSFGAPRTTLPLAAVALAALATPRARQRVLADAPKQGAAGRSGPGAMSGGESNR